VASVAGLEPQPMMGVYCVSKAAVIMMTQVLAAEVAADNIQVNAIAPGWFDTEMSAPAWQQAGIADRLIRDIPARRIGRPEEVGPLAVYLASAASDFMTGQTIFLDGGHTAA
jgi:NAD(P)-dependent dehydrogenase (short-subunit alcohol dehydrogenase family)